MEEHDRGEPTEVDTDAGPSRGGMGATIVAIVAGLAMVGGIALVGVALGRNQADPPPALSTPDTNLDVVPLPAVAGCWTIVDGEGTFVGYRINEQLLSVETASEVTGRTGAVNGGLIIRREEVVAAVVAADLSQLTSDDPKRDEALHSRGLETDAYRDAVFTLGEAIPLPAPIDPGTPIQMSAQGELTLHGVTRPVTVTITAQLLEVDGEPAIELIGTAPIVLADYGIDPPDVGGILTVAGDGTLEMQLLLRVDEATCRSVDAATSGGEPASDTSVPTNT